MVAHAEFLRAALDNDSLSRVLITDPHALLRHTDAAIRALAWLTIAITERPWSITSHDLAAARSAGIEDAHVLHALLQASLFGHLNRIADAVGVEADYPNRFASPHLEPATPAYLRPIDPPPSGVGPVALASREGIVDRLAGWTSYVLDRDEHGLDRRRRSVIRSTVASALGDASVAFEAPADDLDHALVALADLVTLAPWQLGASVYTRVRDLGLADDASVFDAVATASTCGVASRIAVVLASFAR